jgi:hypothetical protein
MVGEVASLAATVKSSSFTSLFNCVLDEELAAISSGELCFVVFRCFMMSEHAPWCTDNYDLHCKY